MIVISAHQQVLEATEGVIKGVNLVLEDAGLQDDLLECYPRLAY